MASVTSNSTVTPRRWFDRFMTASLELDCIGSKRRGRATAGCPTSVLFPRFQRRFRGECGVRAAPRVAGPQQSASEVCEEGGAQWLVTVCCVEPLLLVQVTVVPTPTVSVPGWKPLTVELAMLTLAGV